MGWCDDLQPHSVRRSVIDFSIASLSDAMMRVCVGVEFYVVYFFFM